MERTFATIKQILCKQKMQTNDIKNNKCRNNVEDHILMNKK